MHFFVAGTRAAISFPLTERKSVSLLFVGVFVPDPSTYPADPVYTGSEFLLQFLKTRLCLFAMSCLGHFQELLQVFAFVGERYDFGGVDSLRRHPGQVARGFDEFFMAELRKGMRISAG